MRRRASFRPFWFVSDIHGLSPGGWIENAAFGEIRKKSSLKSQFAVQRSVTSIVPGAWDAEIGFGLHDHGLGRDTTGLIDRQLAGQDVDGIAEVGSGQVGDADQGRIAE